MLEALLESSNHSSDIHILYDVSCTLTKHLLVSTGCLCLMTCSYCECSQNHGRTDILERFYFSVPVFHSYGHILECQVVVISPGQSSCGSHNVLYAIVQFKYSPRNLEGFGLTDSEVVERLWAYLRRFARMTKEMRPSHRIDVLTDGLIHYAEQSSKRLSKFHLYSNFKAINHILCYPQHFYYHLEWKRQFVFKKNQ